MDIEDIIEHVKESILKHGEYMPTLFIEIAATPEAQAELILCGVMLPNTADERSAMLFGAGRQIGQSHQRRKLARVTFVCEMWMSEYRVKDGKPVKRVSPSKDPKRKEIVMIYTAHNTGGTMSHEMHSYEMIRTRDGSLIDLLSYGEITVTQDGLLTSFLAGWDSAKLSDKKFAQMLVGKAGWN